MNITFHVVLAIALALMICPAIPKRNSAKESLGMSIDSGRLVLAFAAGLTGHALLDYVPHCALMPRIVDVLLCGALLLLIWVAIAPPVRRLVVTCVLAALLPDLWDHFPRAFNAELMAIFPVPEVFFPWHISPYSGAITRGSCVISNQHHAVLLAWLGVVFFLKKDLLKRAFQPF